MCIFSFMNCAKTGKTPQPGASTPTDPPPGGFYSTCEAETCLMDTAVCVCAEVFGLKAVTTVSDREQSREASGKVHVWGRGAGVVSV